MSRSLRVIDKENNKLMDKHTNCFAFGSGNYKNVSYHTPTEYLFLDEKRKVKLITRIKKQIAKFDLKPDDVGFVTS